MGVMLNSDYAEPEKQPRKAQSARASGGFFSSLYQGITSLHNGHHILGHSNYRSTSGSGGTNRSTITTMQTKSDKYIFPRKFRKDEPKLTAREQPHNMEM